MRRLIPYDKWEKLEKNIVINEAKNTTEIGNNVEIDGTLYVNGGIEGVLKSIVITAPQGATQGTLTAEQLSEVKEGIEVIEYEGELYILSDNKEESGYLTYTHSGQNNTQTFNIKCITITLNTGAWSLTSTIVGESETRYSTSEKEVGTWINGEKLYRIVYNIENAILLNGTNKLVNEATFEASKVTKAELIAYRKSTNDIFSCGYHNTEKFGLSLGGKNAQGNTKEIRVSTDRNWNEAFNIIIIVEYIK